MLLTLSLIILVGYSFSAIAGRLHLPRIVGMLLAGIVLGPFVLDLIADEVLAISIDLRKIALVIILLRAGLSLDLRDLKAVGKHAILLSIVPASLEIVGALILGPILLGLTLLESAILGTILAAVSPAVLVPKMLQMIDDKIGTKKSIPQMIMAGASVDDIYVIFLFTALVTMASEGTFDANVLLNLPISILAGVITGVILGLGFVWFFKKHHIRDTTKVLLIFSFALFFLTIEQLDVFPFSGLLGTMALGITILAKYPLLAGRLVKRYEKIWVFAEMLLFVLVGVAVDITTIPSVGLYSILLIFGLLVFRSLGVYLATKGKSLTIKEQLFTIFAYIPKATVQASIGSIPLAMGISNGNTMLTVAVLAILITAPIGSFLIDATKKPLLETEQA
ncbi:MAG: cation:proton antiporter [Bacilli bacterium]|nr:cation:proton antiporter [Bacilli bacterium]